MQRQIAVVLVLGCAWLAEAQSSRQMVRRDPRAHYFAIKELYRQTYSGFTPKSYDGMFDLVGCEETAGDPTAEALASYGGESVIPLAQAAHDVVRLRATFTALGYPTEVWKSLLVEYENAAVARAIEEARTGRTREDSHDFQMAHYNRLARALNNYRRQAPRLPRVTVEGGCGAGEVGVHVKTVPPNAYVVFIPRFFHLLCQKQGIDPNDVDRCDWWREAQEGMLMGFAGDYLYRAVWPDGFTRSGRISFTDPRDGETFTIRKQR